MTRGALVSRGKETAEREDLILKELPQVYSIGRRVAKRLPQHEPFEDLVHEGVIGLIEAIRSYDATKSVSLKSFAKFRIQGAIIDSLRQMDWGSRRLRRKGRRVKEAIVKLSAKLGRQPENEEVAAELNVSLSDLYATVQQLNGLRIVGQEVKAAYDPSEKTDLIESAPSRDEGPYDLCLRAEMKNWLTDALRTLSETEQAVLSLHYKEELTMKEIATALQLRESQVCRIHSLVLPKLRAKLHRVFCPE